MENLDKYQKELIEEFKKQIELPDDDESKYLGQFLYYHLKIESDLVRLGLYLNPSLESYLKGRLRFIDKYNILKSSLGGDSDLFSLLNCIKLINKHRNELAHKDISDVKINRASLLGELKAAFGNSNEVVSSLEKTPNDIAFIAKYALITSGLTHLVFRILKFMNQVTPKEGGLALKITKKAEPFFREFRQKEVVTAFKRVEQLGLK